MPPLTAERVLVLAPIGRDALIAKGILREARIPAQICVDLGELVEEVRKGADAAVVTEESLHGADVRELMQWVATQATWSDFPFVVLTRHGGGIERNPAAARVTSMLGNVSFLERPFHPTTLVSVVQTALRSRWRQYECRRLGEELETRVEERTAELAAANRQLLTQMEEQ
jgi:FixJ family two-component response regulator